MSDVGSNVQSMVYGDTETKREKERIERESPYYFQEGEQLAKSGLAGAQRMLPQTEQASQSAAQSFLTAAQNPAYSQAQNLGMQTLRGDFLRGTPEFRQQLASLQAGAARRGADFASRLAQNYALRGASPTSTATAQALQAGQAAERAGANEQALNAILANQARERMLQYQAPEMIYKAAQMPGQLQATAAQQYLDPYRQLTGIVGMDRGPSALEKYNTIVSQKKNAGLADYVQSAADAYMSIYGMGKGKIGRQDLSSGEYGNPKAEGMDWNEVGIGPYGGGR